MKKTILAVLALVIGITGAAHAADPLDAVKQQYLAAAYEEALATLDNLPPGADPDEADKFRALCLLALNRRDEAGKALEALALRRPLLKFDESESPKFVLLFREARVRMLAPASKAMYITAKGSFDKGEFETAKGQFSELLTVLAEPELVKLPETADLKMLADGFTKLVDQQLERQVVPAPAPAPATAVASPPAARPAGAAAAPPGQPAGQRSRPATTPPARTPAPPAGGATATRPQPAGVPVVFTADDPGVVGPVPIDQRLPPWVPPSNLRGESFSGLIEVLIDETGKVTAATMSKSVNPTYDRLLLGAARQWQYRPALQNGRPVKFRRVVSVVLAPTR